MMTFKSKQKGGTFEHDLVEKLNNRINHGGFKRIAGSGAIGTAMGEPLLTGDVSGKVVGLPKSLKIECKVGYGGATQLTMKREWINKILMEAQATNSLGLLVGKFSGARKADGVQEFAVLDINDFIWLMNLISDMDCELAKLYTRINKEEDEK